MWWKTSATSFLLMASVILVTFHIADTYTAEYDDDHEIGSAPSIFDSFKDKYKCKTNRRCFKKGGECVKAGTCTTIEIKETCSKNKCSCCAKDKKKRCKPSANCMKNEGFCLTNKKACKEGTLLKGSCKCKGKWGKRGHCCVPPTVPTTTHKPTTTPEPTTTTPEPTTTPFVAPECDLELTAMPGLVENWNTPNYDGMGRKYGNNDYCCNVTIKVLYSPVQLKIVFKLSQDSVIAKDKDCSYDYLKFNHPSQNISPYCGDISGMELEFLTTSLKTYIVGFEFCSSSADGMTDIGFNMEITVAMKN